MRLRNGEGAPTFGLIEFFEQNSLSFLSPYLDFLLSEVTSKLVISLCLSSTVGFALWFKR